MMTFIYQFDERDIKVEVTILPDSDLPTVLEAFERFLRGAGYSFKGYVDIIDPEEEN